MTDSIKNCTENKIYCQSKYQYNPDHGNIQEIKNKIKNIPAITSNVFPVFFF